MSVPRLIIVGAGPKAMAVAAKAHVLRSLGFSVPEIHIIERHRVGGHWTGTGGYTNGRMQLGTPPEKDIGFPYQSSCWSANEQVNQAMVRMSWQSYLTETGTYAGWIDRGRPAPEHSQWGRYLQWVADQVSDSVTIHFGEVKRIAIRNDAWDVEICHPGDRVCMLQGNGLMLTGPGVPNRVALNATEDPRILGVDDFWRNPGRFRQIGAMRVAIIGAGETAAAIAMELLSNGNDEIRVDIMSPTGMIYSRGESFRENQVYTDPAAGDWKRLSEHDRRVFIHRTDRGVFSLAAQHVLDHSRNLGVIRGRVVEIRSRRGGLQLGLDYDQQTRTHACDLAIMAMGHDQMATLRRMLDESARRRILDQLGLDELTDACVERMIGEGMEVTNLSPMLHLPMLARLTQGPGYANLSCLGRLSDAVLPAYVSSAARARPGASIRRLRAVATDIEEVSTPRGAPVAVANGATTSLPFE